MKIRIKGNSVRYRLSKSDVEQLAATGIVEEMTELPEKTFRYALQIKKGIDNLDASFSNDTITLFVPAEIATAWPNNDVVGHEHTITLTNDRSLYLLVEKDFKCIDTTSGEDQSDNYENPMHSCGPE